MSDATPRREENDRKARRREQQRQYPVANREKTRRRNREWRKANPEKVKVQQAKSRPAIERYNAEHRDKVLAQKRIAERRRAERVKKENEARTRATERTRQYDAAHPEQARERERRYRQSHREQIRERQREYYARNKEKVKARNTERADTDPRYQGFQRRYREANREKIKERQRAHRADPNVYERTLEYNRQWRQRERYRLKAGLPRTQPHHTRKAEKGSNATVADRFFNRERGVDERNRIADELDQLRDEKERTQKIGHRRRIERIAIARERAARVDDYLVRHGTRLREEVRLDSRARELRGAQPYPDLETEVRRRATAALAGRTNRRPPGPLSSEISAGRRPRIEPNTGPSIGASSGATPRLGM